MWGLLGGLAGLAGSFFGMAQADKSLDWQQKAFNQNLQFQQDKLEYDKNLQQTIFQREDNSVQRRVADLKAAGINPLFAAGQGAGAGTPVATHAPHGDTAGMSSAFEKKLMANQMFVQNLKTMAEVRYTTAQTKLAEEEARTLSEKRHAEVESIKLDNKIREFNISLHDIKKEEAMLINDKRLQDLDAGEIEIVAKMLAVAEKEIKITRDLRDYLIDVITHRKSTSDPGSGPVAQLARELDRLKTQRNLPYDDTHLLKHYRNLYRRRNDN